MRVSRATVAVALLLLLQGGLSWRAQVRADSVGRELEALAGRTRDMVLQQRGAAWSRREETLPDGTRVRLEVQGTRKLGLPEGAERREVWLMQVEVRARALSSPRLARRAAGLYPSFSGDPRNPEAAGEVPGGGPEETTR